MSETILDRLLSRLTEAFEFNRNAYVAPVAVLWPDEARQWDSIAERIRTRLPLVSLGKYEPELGRGPAYWIRCVVARTVDAGLGNAPPIVRLPGVARSDLRAIETCQPELAPIAELQYRSHWFSHPNGRDWTVRSFLAHTTRGLGLRIADDAETSAMMLLALDRFIDLPSDRVTNRLLDADFFRDLINPDPVRSLLRWLDDPSGFRSGLDEAQWTAFAQKCKADYGFDPSGAGAVSAAQELGKRNGPWAEVWRRFVETADRYPGVGERLRQAKPMELSFEPNPAWPQDNEVAEDRLRTKLAGFRTLSPEDARKQAAQLAEEHAWRRATVWATLDQAPLAFAVEQLARLAAITTQPLAGKDLSTLTTDFAQRGWQADDALLRALAAARRSADRQAVASAAGVMYRPWLAMGAETLQGLIGPMANDHNYHAGPRVAKTNGVVAVFVDGLRLDVAHRIRDSLASVGFEVALGTALSALPTVTQTSKPAVVPIAPEALAGGPDLYPANATTGTKATIQVLRTLMAEYGIQVLSANETGDPTGPAWTETGDVDRRGHDEGIGLVDYLDEDIGRICSRIQGLLNAGWDGVEVVTDHGWILLPGGMEKVDLPVATTEIKKGRCARLKDGAVVQVPTVPWFWDGDVHIALAPGITCFEVNQEYEHGGVSPQECIVPRILVKAGSGLRQKGRPEITQVKWLGLLCRIEFTVGLAGMRIDIRALPADPKTSIVEAAKETESAGKVALLVPDEEHQGERAHVVLIGRDGQILAQREVVVGQNR